MRTEQLAINTVSTARPAFERTLKAYADAGFRRIEFTLPFLKEWLAAGSRTPQDALELLREYGLSSCGGFEAPVKAFAEPAEQEQNRALLIANAKLLDALGGGVMVVGTDGPAKPSLEALEVVGRALRELAQGIPESVSVALEFNWSPLVKSVRSAARAVEAAGHSRVGILFDPAHYHCTSSKFEDLTPAVVARILHVHVDDMRPKPGELSNCNADRVLPGAGALDLRRIFGRLEEHGYRGWYSLELFNEEFWKLPVEDAARQGYESLLRLCERG